MENTPKKIAYFWILSNNLENVIAYDIKFPNINLNTASTQNDRNYMQLELHKQNNYVDQCDWHEIKCKIMK